MINSSLLRQILALAVPIILIQISIAALTLTDSIMAGGMSVVTLGGLALAITVTNPLVLGMAGLFMVLSGFIAQCFGAASQKSESKKSGTKEAVSGTGASADKESVIKSSQSSFYYLLTGIYLALPLGISTCFIAPFLLETAEAIGVNKELLSVAKVYMSEYKYSFIPLALFLVLRFFLEGISKVSALLLTFVFGIPLNIAANYVLMYGKLGFPERGIAGIGLATTLVWCTNLLVLSFVVFREIKSHSYIPGITLRPPMEYFLNIVKTGFPVSIMLVLEVGLFSVLGLLCSRLGAADAAAHQIVVNIVTFLLNIPLGVGMALTVVIGFQFGAKQFLEIKNCAFHGLALVIFFQGIVVATLMLFSTALVGLYSSDIVVVNTAIGLFGIATLYFLVDAIQIYFAGVMRGMNDSLAPMLINLFCCWFVGVPLALYLVESSLASKGLWIALLVSFTLAAVLMMARLFIKHFAPMNKRILS
jgi:MATE family multidrug resistance protein